MPDAETAGTLRVTGAPGERVALSFTIESNAAISDVSICAPEGVDLHVVLARMQPGAALERTAMRPVRELLLKDDRKELHDSFGYWCGHPRHIPRRILRPRKFYYQPPDVRLEGDVRTSLRPDDVKQMHAVVEIPPSGRRGAIEVRDKRGSLLESIALEAEALPLALAEPPQERFMWYRGTLDCFDPQHFVAEDRFRAQLQMMRMAGFTSISLSERRLDLLNRAIAIAWNAGFRGDLVLLPPLPSDVERADFADFRPVMYVGDEPDADPAKRLPHMREQLSIARALGFRTMTSILSEGFAALPEIDAIDRVDVWFPRNRRNASRRYYWQSHVETPNAHRLLAGAGLWASGAPGIAPYCFQHRSVIGSSPFDDDALWEPAHPQMRPHMTTYPAKRGTIGTLQWSALAAGIADLRWLTTVEQLAPASVESWRASAKQLMLSVFSRPDDVEWEEQAAAVSDQMRNDLIRAAREHFTIARR